ncbi:MAG TPA: copper amine oxidase N-terminal domain-containing protein [Symbiobacteriaceae bacterium]|jgi:hypothetical protein|nr:copper amine oxidase N-terminal domain-containing protein [Symbiobacteriaceae bacterium]
MWFKPLWVKVVTLAAVAAAVLVALPLALANHGDIHAVCQGDMAIVLFRPPGTENVRVVCVNGEPTFFMSLPEVPAYNPIAQAPKAPAQPDDFDGWVTVTLNGRTLLAPFDPLRGMKEPGPYLTASTGRVLMPVRFFTEALGGQVEWWNDARRVRLTLPNRPRPIILWLDEDQALVGARQVDVDQRPVLFQDRTFVPVRFLVESFGGTVQWDQATRTARIELDGLACQSSTLCGEMR